MTNLIQRSKRLLAAVAFLVPLACASASAPSPGTTDGSRTLPDVTLKAFADDRGVQLASFKDKVLLVDIWASWCAPCKEEMPLLDDMAARLQGQGIEVIAVSIDENRPDAAGFLRTRPGWKLTLLHDPEGQLPNLLQPEKMPTSYIVDRQGRIKRVNSGFEREDIEGIERFLVELSKEP